MRKLTFKFCLTLSVLFVNIALAQHTPLSDPANSQLKQEAAEMSFRKSSAVAVINNEPGSCFEDFECMGGYCYGDLPGACRWLKGDGSSCDNRIECVSNNCDLVARKCVGNDPLPDGAQCTTDGQCDSGACVGGSCRRPRRVGDSCSGTTCSYELYCDPTSRQCRRRGSTGESCSSYSQCLSGMCNGQRCSPTKGSGEDCDSNVQCGQSSVCQKGKCTPRRFLASTAKSEPTERW